MLATLGLFVLGVAGMGLTEKQFFPNSNRNEVLVELWLPEGASYQGHRRTGQAAGGGARRRIRTSPPG
jgi:multidrug efflux pump subunit AcrB